MISFNLKTIFQIKRTFCQVKGTHKEGLVKKIIFIFSLFQIIEIFFHIIILIAFNFYAINTLLKNMFFLLKKYINKKRRI